MTLGKSVSLGTTAVDIVKVEQLLTTELRINLNNNSASDLLS